MIVMTRQPGQHAGVAECREVFMLLDGRNFIVAEKPR